MSKISVAYDITVLGNYFDRVDCKSGIFRVIEEVMYEINKINDIELILMGLCSEDFIFNSIRASLYVENNPNLLNPKFINSFRSKLGLSKFYLKHFDPALATGLEKVSKFDLRSIYFRFIKKLLYRVYNWDTMPFVNHQKIDIFHSTYFKLPPSEITVSIPRILTVYDLIPVIAPEFVNSDLTSLYQKVLNSINIERDWIICISEYTKQEFCEYTGMEPHRVFVAPLAAANHFYPVSHADKISTICQRYKIPEGAYFLSLAAPQPRKNLIHLIRCFFRLLSEKPDLDVNLVLVGSKDLGWMHEDIFAAAQSLDKHRSRVIFTGYIPDEDLSEVYSGAKAFIFPSFYEGFGLPPLEAMQCGTPVITSNSTSLPEVVGDAGILVGPTDEDALCQSMLNILCDSGLCQELSQKGLERASQFSWAKCAADTVEVYKAALSER